MSPASSGDGDGSELCDVADVSFLPRSLSEPVPRDEQAALTFSRLSVARVRPAPAPGACLEGRPRGATGAPASAPRTQMRICRPRA